VEPPSSHSRRVFAKTSAAVQRFRRATPRGEGSGVAVDPRQGCARRRLTSSFGLRRQLCLDAGVEQKWFLFCSRRDARVALCPTFPITSCWSASRRPKASRRPIAESSKIPQYPLRDRSTLPALRLVVTLPGRVRPVPSPGRPKVFHIVHVDRLTSIVADGCPAVQEILWLLESVSTAFRDEDSVTGKYFNEIVKELQMAGRGNAAGTNSKLDDCTARIPFVAYRRPCSSRQCP
jgi:hypothetical protein